MVGIIYCAFDVKTHRFYVGQTWGTLESRKNGHLKGYLHFDKAFKKRRADFQWSILFNGECSWQELNEAETYWGGQLSSLWPNGYNHRLGNGKGAISDETRTKMSVAAKMRPPISEKTRAKMSIASGKRRHTDEVRERLSASAKRAANSDLREFRSNMARNRSPELRAKMAEAVKRSWIKRKASQ